VVAGQVEGEWDVAGGHEATYVRHMFVFNSEKVPHEAAEDFPHGKEEGGCCAVLFSTGENDVK